LVLAHGLHDRRAMMRGALWCSPHEFGQILTKFNGVPHLRRDSRSDTIFWIYG
jgi:hypothetical protein